MLLLYFEVVEDPNKILRHLISESNVRQELRSASAEIDKFTQTLLYFG